MEQFKRKISWAITKKIFLPLLIFILFLGTYVLYKVNIEPLISGRLHQELKKYLLTLFIIIVAFTIQRVIAGIISWYQENTIMKSAIFLDSRIILLLSRFLKIVIWIIAFLIILPFYGVNISALIATLGVSSLAIALAAQDTISNIIAGFMIMIDGPFRLGDKIKLPSGEVVIVLDIGIRRSKFLSEDQAIIIMPNLELSKSKIINYTYGKERKIKI
ncbi:MAG: mechanosensitive ion channel [Candidatus Omnitrophica bacterium]|jgi:MscS family membrane protein|nr:mechanosensitive ion channel [Candidatus Omnitrophota bacterium]